MWHWLGGLVLAAMAAHPVWALSCVKPDVATSFQQAQASDDRWGAVIGRLHFDDGQRPAAVADAPRKSVAIRGQLVGESLTEDGFTDPFQGHVTVSFECAGSWCGHVKSGARVLAFVKRVQGRHLVIVEPCGAWLFENPSREDERRLHRCYVGGYCQPED